MLFAIVNVCLMAKPRIFCAIREYKCLHDKICNVQNKPRFAIV